MVQWTVSTGIGSRYVHVVPRSSTQYQIFKFKHTLHWLFGLNVQCMSMFMVAPHVDASLLHSSCYVHVRYIVGTNVACIIHTFQVLIFSLVLACGLLHSKINPINESQNH